MTEYQNYRQNGECNEGKDTGLGAERRSEDIRDTVMWMRSHGCPVNWPPDCAKVGFMNVLMYLVWQCDVSHTTSVTDVGVGGF